MRAPVVIYYLVLLAFAGSLIYFFMSLGESLERQYHLTERAIQQEREVMSRNKMVR